MTPENRKRGGRRSGGGAGRARHRGGERPKAERGPIEPLHPSDQPPEIASFREWSLAPEVQAAIEAMGIEKPTPIQCLAIQPLLDGRDVIAKAETGTGKTLAFGAPMISKIDPGRATVLGLVLCPTRELAQQVASVLEKLGAGRAIRVALVVGGEEMHPQVSSLRGGAQVVVGTPGRVLDLYRQGFLAFPWTEFVILDEADEMLEIGFIDDVKKILSFTPDERQTMHFSATFPHEVLALARESTRNPVEIATAAGVSTVDTIEQSYIEVGEHDRPRALRRLIERSAPTDVFLVFCGRRTEVDQLLRSMERSPIPVKALHGGYDQAARFRVMSAFREGTVKALLATDVASRGLDVHHVTHVVNFSVPKDLEGYTHRIGRTGRAGRSGRAITFVTPEKAHRWHAITRAAPWEVPQAELADLGRSDPPRRHRTGGPSERGRRQAEPQAGRGGESGEREARRGPRGPRRTDGEGRGAERPERGQPETARAGEGRGPRRRRRRGPPQGEAQQREAQPARESGSAPRREAEAVPGDQERRSPAARPREDERPHREGRQRRRGPEGERPERSERPGHSSPRPRGSSPGAGDASFGTGL